MVSLSFPNRRSGELARRTFNRDDANDIASQRRRVRLDGRSAAAVAIRKRISGYKTALNGTKITPFLQQKLHELAQIEVIASAISASALRGESVDLLALNRFTNTIQRLRHAIGLSVPATAQPVPRSLREIVRGRR